MYTYDFDALNNLLTVVLKRNVSAPTWEWLEGEGTRARTTGDVARFNIAFVAMPRKTGKSIVAIDSREQDQIKSARPDLIVSGWTADRLARVWLLMMLNARDHQKYIATIENLFLSAEMSELVALYSALPIYAYPESWRKRCAEGIRNNIGQVLEAVICNNPYPAEQLDEAAWNQLVLKAIFTEKPILEIIGLQKRANRSLAESLSDYAHERWAAHREVNPLLWICVAPFVDQGIFSDIQRLFASEDDREREAAALVCRATDYPPAGELLEQSPRLKELVHSGAISWEGIASKLAATASGN